MGEHDEEEEFTIASQKTRVQVYSPQQHSLFPERLRLPYPDEDILSGYEEDVSFIRDGFTTWVKADFHTILERHAVDTGKALADFREPSARKHDISSQEYHSSAVQKRLSIHNWNPGPRRGREGAIEKLILGKLHIITLQGAIKYVDHEFLTNRFHVTTTEDFHFYRNDLLDTVREGDSGWVIQCVLSRALFRRQPPQRPKITHSDISPHQQ